MELVIVAVLGCALVLAAGSILGFANAYRISKLQEEMRQLRRSVDHVERSLYAAAAPRAVPAPRGPGVPAQRPASVGDASSVEAALAPASYLATVRPEEPAPPLTAAGSGPSLPGASLPGEAEGPAPPAETGAVAEVPAAPVQTSVRATSDVAAAALAAPGMPLAAPGMPRMAPAVLAARLRAEALDEPPGLESRLGKRWATWVGAAALFLGVVFFVRFAIHQGWLVPAARVALGVLFGVALVGGGQAAARREMTSLGQGLTGCGLAILYAVLFAAHALYGLLPPVVAFALMALVTAAGMALAVVRDAKVVAVLALLGGFATPGLLWQAGLGRDGLLVYVLVLDAGVLGVALLKQWRAVDLLAWVGTWGVLGAWLAGEVELASPWPLLAWVLVFFLVFLVVPLAQHLRARTRAHGERLIMAVSNGGIAFGFAAALLADEDVRVLGLVSVAMAAAYGLLAVLARRRTPDDGHARWGLAVAAMAFLTLAVPIVLDLHAVTVAWAIEGVALLLLGYRYGSLPERVFAMVTIVLAAGRLFTVHWPFHEAPFVPVANGAMLTLLFVAACAAAAAVVHRRNRLAAAGPDRVLAGLSEALAAALPLVGLHVELWSYRVLGGDGPDAAWTSALAWLGGSVVVLGVSRWVARARPAEAVGLAALAIGLFLTAWHHAGALAAGAPLGLGPVAAALAAVAALAGHAMAYRAREDGSLRDLRPATNAMIGLAIATATFAATSEGLERLLPAGMGELARALATVVVTAGGAGLLLAAVRRGSVGLFGASLVMTWSAALVAAASYWGGEAPEIVVANPRFVSAAAVVGLMFLQAGQIRALRRGDGEATEPAPAGRRALFAAAIGLLLVLASAEAFVHARAAAGGSEDARFLGQLALTLVWASYAAGLLGLGFLRRVAPLRIAGLALFGLTAGKLLLVDLASLRDLYRVASFLAVGAFLIGASFLYHRLERRLQGRPAS